MITNISVIDDTKSAENQKSVVPSRLEALVVENRAIGNQRAKAKQEVQKFDCISIVSHGPCDNCRWKRRYLKFLEYSVHMKYQIISKWQKITP